MTDLIAEASSQLDLLLNEAYGGSVPLRGRCSVSRNPCRGDMVCTHALQSAAASGMPPQRLAELLLSRLTLGGSFFETAEAASGFLNFRFGSRFYSALTELCLGLRPGDIRSAVAETALPEKPFAFFDRAVGMREAIPALSELRRDGGSPLYHIQYTEERYRRLTAGLTVSAAPFPVSDTERELLLKLAGLPSVLSRCAGNGDLTPLCRSLYALSLTARACLPAFRSRNAASPQVSLCVSSVLSAFVRFFLPA